MPTHRPLAQQHTVHRQALLLVLMVWLLFPTLLQATSPFTGPVVGLSDGDTVSILREGKAVKVRLYGIDTPEKKQPFGTRARQFASELCFQQTVLVLVHATDRYGRLIGDVFLPDGRSVSQELVRAGMAWWYQAYAKRDTMLASLEQEARDAQRGLWADAHPVAPWEWRKQQRQRKKAA